MGVKEEVIYIKADMHTLVFKKDITIGDVAKIECSNSGIVNQIKKIKLFSFINFPKQNKMKNQSEVFSILKVIQKIHQSYPNIHVENVGEEDFIVEYIANPQKPKWLEILKLLLLCIVVFFGAAFTIMAFNNDISIDGVFERIYMQFIGESKPQITELEIFYSIGLLVGILVFFNHVGKKKITADPTPIQVEMRKYEKDMNATFIENAGRKGHNQDVN